LLLCGISVNANGQENLRSSQKKPDSADAESGVN